MESQPSIVKFRNTYHRDGAAKGAETLVGAVGDKVLDGLEVGRGCGS
jgi:hypothetical protein